MAGTAAPSGSTATVSPPAAQAERPPRLATAINHVVMDPDRTQDGTDDLPAGQALTAPRLTEIMDHIVGLLDDDAGWAQVWEADGGVHPHPERLDAAGLAEEAWAKCMDEMFLGCAYGGPSIIANISEKEIFHRFSATSDDPAYSLFVACQHLTTYGALARGLSFKDDLGEASMAANQSVANIPLFKSGKGQWYTNGPMAQAAPPQQGAAPTVPPKRVDTLQAFHTELVKEAAPEHGAGTIYTYNPFAHTAAVEVGAWFGDVYVDKDGRFIVNPKVGQKMLLDAGNAVTEVNKGLKSATAGINSILPSALQVKPPEVGMQHGVEAQMPDVPGVTDIVKGEVPALLPIRVQLEGSHISMVLRTYETTPPKRAVQMLDTTAHTYPGVNGSTDTTKRDYVMFAPLTYMGIFGGEAYSGSPPKNGIPSGTAPFVGMGTLPRLADAGVIEAHLRRARPVGVARLVIVRHTSPTEPTIDDVLFIGRAIPMWSTASPTRNYSISRLLFSLRNTPYRKALKAYWVVYAPRNELSEALWEDGARHRRLDEMEGAWERVYRVAMCVAILGHEDDGSAVEVWRNRTGSSNGSPPRILRSLFVDTWGPSLEWLNKKQQALVKAYTADLAARKAEKDALIGEINRLNPSAQKGDEAARARIEAAKKRIKEIDAMPPPESVLIAQAFAAEPLADKHQPLPMQVRNCLLSTYAAPYLGSVAVPGTLSGASP